MASCELCGTRFREGAIIQYSERKTRDKNNNRISVGGTCLQTIRRAAFGPVSAYRSRQRATWRLFDNHYRGHLSRGAWLTWIIEHAPRRLAALVVDLQQIGAVRSDWDMQKLLEFHDRRRLYPSEALVPIELLRQEPLFRTPPEYLTMYQARRLLRRAGLDDRSATIHIWAQQQRQTKDFQRFISATNERRLQWRSLSEVAKRALVALSVLVPYPREKKAEDLTALFQFTSVRTEGQFVWHPLNGVGFVNPRDYRENGTACVAFFPRIGRSGLYDIRYFYSVIPINTTSIDNIERWAFGQVSD